MTIPHPIPPPLPPDAPPTHPPAQISETTTKANAALGGGAVGGGIGAAIATLVVYAIWKGAAPPGIEAAMGAVITAVLGGAGAWIATYYAPRNRPLPPKLGPD